MIRRNWVLAGGLASLVLFLAACGSPPSETRGNPSEGTYDGTELDGEAPEFRLIDQRGEAVSLSDFRGRVVVLAFLDPNCTDICPLTAMHFRQTHEALGDDAARVAFLAVNANPHAGSVDDVASATDLWGMADVPAWYFLTGSAEELEAVWRGYGALGGIPQPGKPGEVQHTPGVFVIAPDGNQDRYISTAFDRALSLDEVLKERVRALLAAGRG